MPDAMPGNEIGGTFVPYWTDEPLEPELELDVAELETAHL